MEPFGLPTLEELMRPDEKDRLELVLGLVAPLGTELGRVYQALAASLSSVGYDSRVIRVADLLDTSQYRPYGDLPRRGEADYYDRRMDAGDMLRREYKTGAALAARTIASLQDQREKDTDSREAMRSNFVSIVHSLKHPDEVALLRGVYGNRFLLIAVSEPEQDRRVNLRERLSDERTKFSAGAVSSKAEELIARDEQDPSDPFGQNVRDTYSLADVFIATARGSSANDGARRFVELLFGNPFLTPTRDELAMFHAAAAARRSSAAGRQVGAVITTQNGEVVATGVNEVPRADGGQYWTGDDPDHRDFMFERDPNEEFKRRTVAEILQRLQQAKWLNERYDAMAPLALRDEALKPSSSLAGGSILSSTRVMGLLEFGRIVHAEMAAITDAASRGISISGCVLYTTTYPCHDCAKHLLSAGIARVVYVAPYPRSLVSALFSDLIDVEGATPGPGRLSFQPFVGIAPAQFLRLFTAPKRREEDGRFVVWEPIKSRPRLIGRDVALLTKQREQMILLAERSAILAEKRILEDLMKKMTVDTDGDSTS
jgi:deoxycytidylate deaminase